MLEVGRALKEASVPKSSVEMSQLMTEDFSCELYELHELHRAVETNWHLLMELLP